MNSARSLLPAIVVPWYAVTCASLVLAACDTRAPALVDDSGDASSLYALNDRGDCTLPEPVNTSTIVEIVTPSAELPCRIALRESGIVIRGDSAGRWPDPGQFLARDSKGYFYTSVARSSAPIAVWNPDGSFSRTLGRAGDGPGEFRRSQIEPLIFVDGKDRVFVRHDGGRWTVFSNDSASAQQHRLSSTLNGATVSAVLPGGSIVASGASVGAENHFTVLPTGDSVAHTFGAVPPELRTGFVELLSRPIAAAGDTMFWAGPHSVAGHGYRMELWSVHGNLLKTIQRRADWFNEIVVIDTLGPPPPSVQPRNVDGDGLLLTMSWISNEQFWKISGARELPPSDSLPDRTHIFIEVIDPQGGRVLASEGVTLRALSNGRIPRFFISGTRFGYALRRLPDGRGELHMMEYRLVSAK